MRKIRELLRLRLGEGMTLRTVAAVTGLPYTTVADHVARAVRCGIGWPPPEGMDDGELEKKLFAQEPSPPKETRPVPDWACRFDTPTWTHRDTLIWTHPPRVTGSYPV